MGYCIYHEEGNIKIKKENMNLILHKLSNYFKHGGELRWVDGFDIEDVAEAEDYNEALMQVWEDLRYTYDENDTYYIINDFYGEKLGDDLKLFQLIAEYCEDGYLQFNGEDGDHFRIVIKDGKAFEKWAELSWE